MQQWKLENLDVVKINELSKRKKFMNPRKLEVKGNSRGGVYPIIKRYWVCYRCVS